MCMLASLKQLHRTTIHMTMKRFVRKVVLRVRMMITLFAIVAISNSMRHVASAIQCNTHLPFTTYTAECHIRVEHARNWSAQTSESVDASRVHNSRLHAGGVLLGCWLPRRGKCSSAVLLTNVDVNRLRTAPRTMFGICTKMQTWRLAHAL